MTEVEDEVEVNSLPGAMGPWLMTEPRWASVVGETGGVIKAAWQ